jgi:hypothetical protein
MSFAKLFEDNEFIDKCFSIKMPIYPLQNKWTLKMHKSTCYDWGLESFSDLAKVHSVQGLVMMEKYVFTEHIDNAKHNMLFFLKNDVVPLWEHESNMDGGCWTWSFDDVSKGANVYYKLVKDIAGATYRGHEHINCVNFTPKKHQTNIRIWIKNKNQDINNEEYDLVKNETKPSSEYYEIDAEPFFRMWKDST